MALAIRDQWHSPVPSYLGTYRFDRRIQWQGVGSQMPGPAGGEHGVRLFGQSQGAQTRGWFEPSRVMPNVISELEHTAGRPLALHMSRITVLIKIRG